jgi:hypothetical protein
MGGGVRECWWVGKLVMMMTMMGFCLVELVSSSRRSFAAAREFVRCA